MEKDKEKMARLIEYEPTEEQDKQQEQSEREARAWLQANKIERLKEQITQKINSLEKTTMLKKPKKKSELMEIPDSKKDS